MRPSAGGQTSRDRNFRLRLGVFDDNKCRRPGRLRLTFPVFETRKRFLAALFVFNFGMDSALRVVLPG